MQGLASMWVDQSRETQVGTSPCAYRWKDRLDVDGRKAVDLLVCFPERD